MQMYVEGPIVIYQFEASVVFAWHSFIDPSSSIHNGSKIDLTPLLRNVTIANRCVKWAVEY